MQQNGHQNGFHPEEENHENEASIYGNGSQPSAMTHAVAT